MKYMKKLNHIIPALLSAAAFLALFASQNARANPEFSGSIAFGSSGVTTDNPVLQLATDFTLVKPYADMATGEYATLGITNLTPVTFNGFKFNPPVGAVDPLWTFDVGSTVVSFDAISETSTFVPKGTAGEWVILGNGIASISGFANTPGNFTVNLSDSGTMVVAFDSTAAALPAVPDGGSPVALLGGALTVLGLCSRKFSC
jgi:hypothetical protein